jgi:hypothetical protein
MRRPRGEYDEREWLALKMRTGRRLGLCRRLRRFWRRLGGKGGA